MPSTGFTLGCFYSLITSVVLTRRVIDFMHPVDLRKGLIRSNL